ncbi:MAG: PhoP regulatory network YrbL family protein [Cellvibrionaceae bacterium]|nr:PhoP regulatory network YrbL family protein [Cellvibrionaceae bacterium]
MLKLSELEPLFVGGTRYCYQHPEHPDRVVKVLRPDRTGEARRALQTSWKRFLPASSFDDQLKEIKAYRTLAKQNNPRVWEHIPKLFGLEQTDMGLGIVTELWRNADGSLAYNVEDMCRQGMSEELAAGIEEFVQWLQAETIISRDILPHNVIAARQPDGSLKVAIVDGIGNSEFFPLSTWFKFFGGLKIKRKLKKFRYRIHILLPGNEDK